MKRTLLLTALTLASCRTFTLTEYADAARKGGVRCLAVEPDMTISSPFDPGYTHKLLTQLRDNLEPIEELLEVEVPPTLTVRFEAVEMPDLELTELPDGSFDVKGFEVPTLHGFRGYSVWSENSQRVTIFVAPESKVTKSNGGVASAIIQFDTDSLMRHELAHVCARLAGLHGSTWFSEGIAEEFEARELDPYGDLIVTQLPRAMKLARDQHDDYTIDDLLDWEENFTLDNVDEAEPFRMGRPLALSLIRFLLERTRGESFRAKLEAIEAMEPDELRALEPQWKAWLEALPRTL